MTDKDRGVERELVVKQHLGGGVTLVTLTRADKRNAVNPQMASEFEELVIDLEEDEETSVIILTGSGKIFSAGADLKEVAGGRLNDCFRPQTGFAGFVNSARAKPWIAAVNGPALAGGFEIALACDLIVASTEATFGLPEVKRGLIASAGGLYRLPRILPRPLATELIICGGSFDAERAYSMGIINRICAPAKLLDEAVQLARTIAVNAPLAVRESLRFARRASFFDDPALHAEVEQAQAKLQQTADYREGALAFVEKRSPVWKGR